jgi:hypothetical protein
MEGGRRCTSSCSAMLPPATELGQGWISWHKTQAPQDGFNSFDETVTEMETAIPDDLMRLIREIYPTMNVNERDSRLARSKDDPARVQRLCRRLESECQVNVHYWLDGNYDICHWIRLSTSREKPVSGHPKARHEDYRTGDIEVQMNISRAAPLAAMTWQVLGKLHWEILPEPPAKLKSLETCILSQLRSEGIEVIPRDILLRPVPGMGGRVFDNPEPPRVFECLFSWI